MTRSLAYYNENNTYAAEWLRNLIAEGVIAPGDVDERDIQDVKPDDLQNYTQAHFFAGIGVWSYALRQAGWEDDRPVWTGSTPCQPFSAAGKGSGFADERHLWPSFYHLIRERRPAILFGEQVASKDGLAWLDLVHADMEAADYAFRAFDLCAASVGAPHIRQRLFFVAHADGRNTGAERQQRSGQQRLQPQDRGVRSVADSAGSRFSGPLENPKTDSRDEARLRLSSAERGTGDVANAEGVGLLRRSDDEDGRRRERASGQGCEARERVDTERAGLEGHGGHGDEGRQSGRVGAQPGRSVAASGAVGGLGNTQRIGAGRDARTSPETQIGSAVRSVGDDARSPGSVVELADAARGGLGEQRSPEIAGGGGHTDSGYAANSPGPTNGYWRDADWLGCTDGKWRPVMPGSFPLAPRSAFGLGSGSAFAGKSRAKMLRGYGNAIVAPLAIEFIKAAMECLP